MRRRLRRFVFTGLSALSLLVCAAVSALWVRSYRVADAINYHYRRHEGGALHSLTAESHDGRIALWWEQWQRGGAVGPSFQRWAGSKPYLDFDPRDVKLSCAGVCWGTYDHRDAARAGWFLVIPSWAVAVPLAFAGSLSIRSVSSRRRRIRAGLCRSCGYDLTGNASGTCPECGTSNVANGSKT